jgi:hypothetical protein
MEKIDALREYLETRRLHVGVGMESIAGNILAKLRAFLRSIGAGGTDPLPKAPWTTKEFREFILGDLLTEEGARRHTFSNKPVIIKGYDAGWFTIGGKPVATHKQAYYSILSDEHAEYKNLVLTKKDTCIKYLDWAYRITQTLILNDHRGVPSDYDILGEARPQTVAEALVGDTAYWLGYPRPLPLAFSKPFDDAMLTVIDILVKPPKVAQVTLPGPLPIDITRYAQVYREFDDLITLLNELFEQFDTKVGKLKTYRELSRSDEGYHRMLTDIDQEMMMYFNIELFSALYSRAGSLQAAIAHYLYEALAKD